MKMKYWLILVGLIILLGVNLFYNHFMRPDVSDVKSVPIETFIVNTGKEDINFKIFPNSSQEVGQNIIIFMNTIEVDNWEVKKITLYEDGEAIHESAGLPKMISKIKYTEACARSYYAVFTYTNGIERKTDTKRVNFTGNIIDRYPQDVNIDVHAGELKFFAYDYGDNPGIESIILVEKSKNGEVRKSIDNIYNHGLGFYSASESLDMTKTGRYEYCAWFTDKRGQKTRSDMIVVEYK